MVCRAEGGGPGATEVTRAGLAGGRMANPRQRRKQRSSSGKVKFSKQSAKNKHKVVVSGPEMLVQNWDRSKTVRQNYRALGLMPNLNPRQAGGIEPVEPIPFALAQQTAATMDDLLDANFDDDSDEDEDDDEDVPMASTSAAPAPAPAPARLAPGMARIIRDATGKVVRIVMAGEDGREVEEEVKQVQREEGDDGEDDDEEEESDEDDEAETAATKAAKGKAPAAVGTPWGAPMTEFASERGDAWLPEQPLSGPRSTGQGIPIHPRRELVDAKTDVVRELEAYAARDRGRVERHTSEFERDWLLDVVDKYGEDYERMARDRKSNPLQRTVGELRRQIAKAGGMSKLKAKAARRAQEAEAGAGAA